MIEIRVDEKTAVEEKMVLDELTKSQTIFERLDALEAGLDSVEKVINSLNTDFVPDATESINNADLNELFGRVIIAYGNQCANRPSGLNGYLINIPHDKRPTVYNKQIWITRPNNDVFIRNMDNEEWGEWIPLHYDTGWKNLSLASGITVHNADRPVQYRRINNTVYIRGGIKGIKADSTLIATLPSGYRPQYAFYFVQNMSYTKGTPQSYANFARFVIKTDGSLIMQYTSDSFEHDAANWFDIECSFLID